jgi:hypothetical protein
MKATKLLREQHQRIEQLLREVGHERGARLSLVLRLVEELMTHLSIEDTLFLGTVADSTAIPVEPYRREQARVRNAVLQAVFVEDDDSLFDTRLGEPATEFRRHAGVVERDLFPLVEVQLRSEQLESIGTRMQSYWDCAVGRERIAPRHSHAAE